VSKSTLEYFCTLSVHLEDFKILLKQNIFVSFKCSFIREKTKVN
jgi:hypothetical protein